MWGTVRYLCVQTGHDGVIMWGTVGTFGYEDHDPGAWSFHIMTI